MGNWTIVTTDAQDDAIAWAHAQSLKPPEGFVTAPQVVPLATTTTVEEFMQAQTIALTVEPMAMRQQSAMMAEDLAAFQSVPDENKAAFRADVEASVQAYGGTVPASTLSYLWSANTAAPPRDLSVELDQGEAKWPELTKLTAHSLDAQSVDRMAMLMAVAANTVVRIEDAASPANFVVVLITGAPIQRQGADGYVEFPAVFNQRGGTFAALDAQPLTLTFA